MYVSHGYDTEQQYSNEFKLTDFHFITDNPWLTEKEQQVCFKVRHTDGFHQGNLILKNGICHIRSSEKIQGIAPGQFGVIYDKDAHLCIGSGEIRK